MKCTKCGYENKDDALYCGMCMEPFRKKSPPAWDAPEWSQAGKINPPSAGEEVLASSWVWCLSAFVISFFITPKFRLIWFPFRFVKVFAHEMGHTVIMWLFGHFAIPAVNPVDTGGVAISLSYTPSFCVFLLLVIGGLTFFYRKYKGVILAGISVALVYGLLAFTPAKDWLISAGGILGEYILAGVCLYLCLFKTKFQSGLVAAERLLYGIIGWHVIIEGLEFLFKLKSDRAFYNSYVSGSSWQAGMTGDLAKIAFDINYRFSMNSFDSIVNIFIALAFVPLIILAIIIFRKMGQKGS
ncbi:M50 family metallopeptidase [bacterium]|nr:M50 family metallopeptidase [bacterium]